MATLGIPRSTQRKSVRRGMDIMIKNMVIVSLMLVIGAILLVDTAPETAVTTPEISKADSYLRPVREGNCWRQYVGKGDRDSILVCH